MDTGILERVGLTPNEVKVYLALLETGSTTTGRIIKKTGMFGTRVYESLDRLVSKGLVTFVVMANRKHFQAVPPERFLTLLKEMEDEVMEILPELKLKQELAKVQQAATVYQGVKGIKSALDNMLNELKNGERYYVLAAGMMKEVLGAYYDIFQRKKESKRIFPLIIYDTSVRKRKGALEKTYGMPRFYNMRHAAPTDTFIYNDKVILIVWNSLPPFAVLITSKDLAQSYKTYFGIIWKKAKLLKPALCKK